MGKKIKRTLLSCWESLYLFFPWPDILLEKHCNGYLDSNDILWTGNGLWLFLLKVLLAFFFFFPLPPSDNVIIAQSLAWAIGYLKVLEGLSLQIEFTHLLGKTRNWCYNNKEAPADWKGNWSRDQILPAPELAWGGLHSPVTYNMICLYTTITCHRENSNLLISYMKLLHNLPLEHLQLYLSSCSA